MADIEIQHQHQHGQQEALRRARELATALADEYKIEGSWDDQGVFTITSPVTGTITVLDDTVLVSLSLNFMMRFMKGRIESGIREQLVAALDA